MKISLLSCAIVVCVTGLISASPASGQSALKTEISVKINAGTLDKAVEQLRSATNLSFYYDADVLKKYHITAHEFNRQPVAKVLNSILPQNNLVFTESDGSIIISQQAKTANADPGKIAGKIVDEKGIPLPGASVKVVEINKTVTSNVEGNFSIVLNPGTYTVEARYISYQLKSFKGVQVNAKATTTLNITLQPSSQELNQVVVTALGIKREEKALGYAVTTIKGDELMDAVSNNWTDALTGKVAGLNLIKSGDGPAGSNRVILRGEGALNGDNDALIVVDGVIVNSKITGQSGSAYLDSQESPVDYGSGLSNINPEDIESVTVLKGAGASALYGSRGANGAIIITTKSGKATPKSIGISFNSNATFGTINRWPDYQYEYGQGASGQDRYYSWGATADGASTRSTGDAWGAKFDGQSYFQYDPVTQKGGTERTPWVPYPNNHKDFFNTSKTFTNSLSISGGNAKTTARLSFTNLENEWIVPNTGYTRNSIALSVNQKLTDKFQITSQINYTNTYSDNLPSTGYNNNTINYFMIGLDPSMDINWFKDYWVHGQEGITQNKPFSSVFDNPYLQAYEMLNKSNRNGIVGNIMATYNFSKNLSLMARTSTDLYSEARSQQRPKDTQRFKQGMYRTQNIVAQELNSDFLLRYSHSFGSKVKTNYSLGGSHMSNRYNRDELRADQLNYPGIYNFANSLVVPVAYPYQSRYTVNSLYGLVQFSYNDYLFLDATGRNDWTSTLATVNSTENVSLFYPSVNLSAILSDMVKLPREFSFAKLRASWSKVGGGGTNPYLTSYAYNQATGFPAGLKNPTAIANENLKPFLSTTIELGTDLRFFKNRLGVDVAVYRKRTNRQIITAQLDRASGYSGVILNGGLVQNKGLEIEANGSPFKKKNGFSWTITGTYSVNHNKILSLPDSTIVMYTGPRGTMEARVGGSLGDIYGQGYLRSPDGQIVYDNQGYPILDQNSKLRGNSNPDWMASIKNDFSYKQFRLSVLFDGQFGGMAYSLTHVRLALSGKLKETLPGRYNGIIGEGVVQNPDGSYRKNDIVATNIQAYYAAHYVADNVESNLFSTSFVKLREARLDYTLPVKFNKRLKLQNAAIGVFGRDLFVFSKWPAFDPEFGTLNNGDITRGFETGQFPSTRTFGVNLKVGF
ncbi:SusC/RagA family TonB-linked outer membrane protein [Pedobacter sp. BS3]|uniref:SusC/RagA family TonB-linked outer membrane protein n=1 Tax=Pedobacter sp. BS3 TaxID=2567937 RepID=UPI0011EBB1E4|nr:SusC/RagA family TonB-linked outer membrane protein [Pedobacter sp. BS3]TZF84788.1 SusC/RagA family TonB-linked outer membrane protein [Pedobacter sp. BS3]